MHSILSRIVIAWLATIASAQPAGAEAEPADVTFDAAWLNKHPRLLFGADDVERMKDNLTGPIGSIIDEQFRAYLRASGPPAKPGFQRNATDAQRQGFWRMPTLAVHYTLTGDRDTLAKGRGFLEMLVDLEHWETGGERDSGMGAANIMVGAALLYDALHNDLDPAFRERVRQKLLTHARRMYRGGHLNENNATAYWQNDPQNNHRWHRNAGLMLCLLAAYQGSDEEKALLRKAGHDLDYVARWLPEDGTSHEGPTYMIFGGSHLIVAMHAADRLLGGRRLRTPFFQSVGRFMVQSMTPDQKGLFLFGDAAGGSLASGYANFLYKVADVYDQTEVQAAMDAAWRREPAKMTHTAWQAIVWRDPALGGERFNPPTRAFFDDLGIAILRSGWADDAAGAMFKCGPFGGFRLNDYRNRHDHKYINVAHDDPDANSFILWKGGGLVAETSRYSKRKQSSNHNTILINGMGQMAEGRPEGGGWSQPARGKVDMTDMAYVTAYRPGEQVVIVEGEASGSYRAYRDRKNGKTRPALDRFRRTLVWVEGDYLLVLDDIAAEQSVNVTWLMQAPKLEPMDRAAHHYIMARDQTTIPMRVAASQPLERRIVESSADHRGKALGWAQLRLSTETKAIRLASVYDLWGRGDIQVTLNTDGEKATVVVAGADLDDRWDWTRAADNRTAATLVGRRTGEVIGEIDASHTTEQPE